MRHSKTKTLTGIIFFLIWILLLVFFKTLRTDLSRDPAGFLETTNILLLYLNIPVFFIWLTLDISLALFVTLVSIIFLIMFFLDRLYVLLPLSFIATSFIGHRLSRKSAKDIRDLEVGIEKIEEQSNLLGEECKYKENDNLRMRDSMKRISQLKDVIADYSRMLSEEELVDSITENCFKLFGGANRFLFYIVDTERQELRLVRSRTRETPFPVKAKKGDMFDRWVLRQILPLLVNDIRKDFRFSLEEELDKGFESVIAAPLTSERKVLGVLRIDSARKNAFTQSDIRFLDLLGNLSSVALQNAILYKKVEELAIRDSLTGLYVHKYFVERLEDEVKRALKNDTDLSILLLDLDRFKSYNDKYGHMAGDLVLRHVASALESYVKPGDIISRYGGEEFIFLMQNKAKSDAVKLAEEIRKKINDTPLVLRREKTNITVSVGVASCPSEARMTKELLMLADSRLYKAKEKGRNRIWSK